MRNVHLYRGTGTYIGWPSQLSNHYVPDLHGTREEVVELFREYFMMALGRSGRGPGLRRVREEFQVLVEQLRRGEDVNLLCTCPPLLCHGTVIAEQLLVAARGEEDQGG